MLFSTGANYGPTTWEFMMDVLDRHACIPGMKELRHVEVASCLMKHMNSQAEILVLYSDSCGGQNRNIGIVCTLLANSDFPYTCKCIDHKFMVSGHSFLPNDRDFSSVETARRKRDHIYLPEHWYELIRTARHNNPFHVCVMEPTDFVSLNDVKRAL